MRPLLDEAGAHLATFGGASSSDESAVQKLTAGWHALLLSERNTAAKARASVEAYSAREATRQQCALFDSVLENRLPSATAA
jgi:hypothetical protein